MVLYEIYKNSAAEIAQLHEYNIFFYKESKETFFPWSDSICSRNSVFSSKLLSQIAQKYVFFTAWFDDFRSQLKVQYLSHIWYILTIAFH